MNEQRDLLKRLLRLFPIKVIKEIYEEDGNASDVIEAITGNYAPKNILDFVKNQYLYTRQHIYLFRLNSSFNANKMADFPLKVKDSSIANNSHNYFFLPKITYQVTLYNPLEEAELQFLQPVSITIKNRILMINFTKIEKTVYSYYPPDRTASKKGQSNHETETLALIKGFFEEEFGITQLDINQGVKHLWDSDFIDGRKVQWRRDSSIATEVMDENYTFKQKYPAEFVELMNQPLSKTLFKCMREDEALCDIFECDPSVGELNIPKFPKSVNQVKNVVTEILKYN